MKSLISVSGFFVGLLAAFSQLSIARAIELCPSDVTLSPLCSIKLDNSSTIVRDVINILLIVAVVLSVIFLIWGGIKWVLSGGDKGAIESARSTITGALIGLVIAFAAFLLVSVVMYIFLGSSLTNFTIPTLLP